MPYLKELNPGQLEAVTAPPGPVLVLAGAGTGKTRVLTTRIAYLMKEAGIAPSGILSVTFTNKAAGEMRERVGGIVGSDARSIWLGTFHSVGLRILRKEGRRTQLGNDFTVFDDDDQLSLVKEILKELSLNDKTNNPRAILTKINHAKNELQGPKDYASAGESFIAERVGKVYALYQKKLVEMRAADFGDLITMPIRLFNEEPKLLERYRDRFGNVLVDEYQDTNRAQYILMNMLASGHKNIFAVGDPDQSIYGWRGADIRNILDFKEDWPGASVLRLEQNYRSTQKILSAANSIIARNLGRMEKNLWTENIEGELPLYEEAMDERDEARIATDRMRALMDEDPELKYSDVAVFYRTNAQSRVFEEHLIREGIPYTVVGGVRFYERKEIKDAVAMLKVAANPSDRVSLKRIINTPARGIGPVALQKLAVLAGELGATILDALEEAVKRGMIKKPAAGEFVRAYKKFAESEGDATLHERAMRLIEDTGYMGMLVGEATDESLERAENLHELISAIKDFESATEDATLASFLDHVALISDIDSFEAEGAEGKGEKLTLMTLHSAKGLEFPVVFMAGLEDGLFPHGRSLGSADEMEEERRLCYVGMTRAKERLFLTGAATRNIYGETNFQVRSRFIDEIAPEFISDGSEGDDPAGPAGAGAAGSDEMYYTLDESQIEGVGAGAVAAAGGGAAATWGEGVGATWSIGLVVEHPSFGTGVVKRVEGRGDDAKLTVVFKRGGLKKLAVKYANLTIPSSSAGL